MVSGLINIPSVVIADEGDHIIEGQVTFGDVGADTLDLTVINLEIEDEDEVTTDEDGYYTINIEDLGWEVDDQTNILIVVPGTGDEDIDRGVEIETSEDYYYYIANFDLEDITEVYFPSAPWLLGQTAYLGEVYLEKYDPGGGADTDYDDEDVDYFIRTAIDHTYEWEFSVRFNDPRDLPEELYRERHTASSQQINQLGISTAIDSWTQFNPPHDTDYSTIGNANSLCGTYDTWYKCYSRAGFDCEYWRGDLSKWVAGGSGYGEIYHWVYLV
jgi:hypothetical protein